ncbi:RNA polymerase sigma factor [Halarcobacter sp.]|uniref:RNA polymerase sigma factor n=1 Tax=Halarcobacter sp. TaxID=2321133 RepID=UPI003A93AD48
MKAIWEKIQNNNKQAFKDLFDLYYKELCLYMVQFTHNINDAEDLVQETFIKLWDKRYSIHISTSVKAYLYKITYNAYIDKVRLKKRKELFLIEFKHSILIAEIEEPEDKERINKIKKIVENLPEKCREILLLSKQEGLKNREIASHLNISIKTVESQIRIAFQKIRKGYKNFDL